MSDRRRDPAPIIVAALIGILLVVGVRALVSSSSSSSPANAGSASASASSGGPIDSSCTVVTVAASSEKAALLKAIASDYDAEHRTVGSGCAQVSVVSKASGGAATALAAGWNDAVDGPRPDVWSPAASSWTVLLRQQTTTLDKPDLVPPTLESIAQTPLVVAMPRPMAQALGWPDKPIGWRDLFTLAKDPRGWGSVGHPEWGRFKLAPTPATPRLLPPPPTPLSPPGTLWNPTRHPSPPPPPLPPHGALPAGPPVVLAALREVGGRVTLVEQSMAGSDLARLDAERTRLAASVAAATDDRLRAETQRGLDAVAEQREVAVRLATLRDTLLARMETAVLGLEGLAARMGEVVALGATAIEHDRAAELVTSLTGELESMRTGLDDARRLADPPPAATGSTWCRRGRGPGR